MTACKNTGREQDSEPVHPIRLCHDVLSLLGEEDTLVVDGGDIQCWCEMASNTWAFPQDRRHNRQRSVGTDGHGAGLRHRRQHGETGE